MSDRTEELMSAYVAENEVEDKAAPVAPAPEPQEPPIQRRAAKVETVEPEAEAPHAVRQPEKTMQERAREFRSSARGSAPVTGDAGLEYRDNIGWLPIDVKELPTQGMFYPEDIKIRIRAARGEEIKHWSTMNDQDVQQFMRTDDILNYMIEHCCSVSIEGVGGNCWKDLKGVDRLYILMAIREFTFINGENNLSVTIREGESMPVTKEMVDFINIPEDVMKFYSSIDRCFVFNVNGKTIKMHVPSIGVTAWIKNYVTNKVNSRESYDEDFAQFAPALIADYRKLSQRAYEDMVQSSRGWGAKEWSVVSYVMDKLNAATEPKVKYIENGVEAEIPLTFRGGIKSIFMLSNPLLDLG